MEEKKEVKAESEAKKPEEEKLVRIIVSERVSIILPEKTTTGRDILAAYTALAGMFFEARPDLEYKKQAARSLKNALKFVTSGKYMEAKKKAAPKKA